MVANVTIIEHWGNHIPGDSYTPASNDERKSLLSAGIATGTGGSNAVTALGGRRLGSLASGVPDPGLGLAGDEVLLKDSGKVWYRDDVGWKWADKVNAIGNAPVSATLADGFGLHTATLTANVTAVAYPTHQIGKRFRLYLTQGGTGSFTFAFGTAVKWAGGTSPTLSTAAAKVDSIDFIGYATGLWHGTAALDVR